MIFSYNSKIIFVKTHVVGAHTEANEILMSIHNIGFYEQISKIIN